MYRKTILIKLLTFFSLFLLTPHHVTADDRYKVGAVLPLTGMVAGMGRATQNGIILFTEREPEKAALLHVLYEDSKYDGKETLTALNKLSKVDKISLMLVWGNTPSDVAAPVAKKLHLDSVYVSHDDHSSNSPQALDLGPSFSAGAQMMLSHLRQAGSANFGSLVVNAGNIIKFIDELDNELKTKLYREVVPLDLFQFQAQILKGKSKSIKEYLLIVLPEQALSFAKQVKNLGLNYSIIGGDVFADDAFLTEFTTYLPNTKLLYGQVAPWFAKAYKERFGNSSYLLEAASGYVFAQLAAELATMQNSKISLQEKVRSIDISRLAYQEAKFTGPGSRITAPFALIPAAQYLALANR